MSGTYIYTTVISNKLKARLKAKIKLNTTVNGQCIMWTGNEVTTNGYPCSRITINAKTTKVRLHRMFFYIQNGCTPLKISDHISHLCNHKMCLNIEHLSLENACVNSQRHSCFSNGICFGHGTYPRCMIGNIQKLLCSLVTFFFVNVP